MIAAYDMAGVIAVGIGFLVVLIVVVPVAVMDRRRERLAQLPGDGNTSERASTADSAEGAKPHAVEAAGASCQEPPDPVAHLRPLAPTSTTGGRTAGTADPVTHKPVRRAR